MRAGLEKKILSQHNTILGLSTVMSKLGRNMNHYEASQIENHLKAISPFQFNL